MAQALCPTSAAFLARNAAVPSDGMPSVVGPSVFESTSLCAFAGLSHHSAFGTAYHRLQLFLGPEPGQGCAQHCGQPAMRNHMA